MDAWIWGFLAGMIVGLAMGLACYIVFENQRVTK